MFFAAGTGVLDQRVVVVSGLLEVVGGDRGITLLGLGDLHERASLGRFRLAVVDVSHLAVPPDVDDRDDRHPQRPDDADHEPEEEQDLAVERDRLPKLAELVHRLGHVVQGVDQALQGFDHGIASGTGWIERKCCSGRLSRAR